MRKKNFTNYILSDANTPIEFIEGVTNSSGKDWTLIEKKLNPRMPKWRKKLKDFWFTFKFTSKSRHIGCVLAWQQMYGILPAFFNRYIFHRRNLNISIMTFIYKPKNGLGGKLYRWLVNSAISSKNVSNIFVYSQSEVQHYSTIFPKAKEKFHFVKFGLPVSNTNYTDTALKNENYFFSTGFSNRDYEFLINVFNNTPLKLKIACPHLKTAIPQNVEILDNCFGEEMKRQMCNSIAVLIPLKNLNISSGQLVFITAMQLGKPLVITDSIPTRTYLDHNIDAIIVPNDIKQWRDAIDKLINDNEFYDKMCRHNRQHSITEFSIDRLGTDIGRFIR